MQKIQCLVYEDFEQRKDTKIKVKHEQQRKCEVELFTNDFIFVKNNQYWCCQSDDGPNQQKKRIEVEATMQVAIRWVYQDWDKDDRC